METIETKHTPGPWIVRMTASGNPFIYDDATGKNIAGVAGTRPGIDADESQANAALIAQAPDLLAERDKLAAINAELVAALEDASFLLAKIGKFPGDLLQFMGSIIRSVQDARAALAKAKGE